MKIFLAKYIAAELENKRPGREGFPMPAGFTLYVEIFMDFVPQIGMEIEIKDIKEKITRIVIKKDGVWCWGETRDLCADGYSDENYVPMGMPKKDLKEAKERYENLGWRIL